MNKNSVNWTTAQSTKEIIHLNDKVLLIELLET